MYPVQLRVGAHDRRRLSLLDGDLKGRQIKLPQGALVQHTVGGEAAFFLRIYGEVLETGADALRFCAPDKTRRQLACQIGVLAEILEIPPAERVALEIGTGAEDKADPLLSGFLADGRTDGRQQLRVPASGGGHLGGKASGLSGFVDAQHIRHILLLAQAMRAIAHKQGGNAILLIFFGFPEVFTGAKGDFIFQSHLL